MQNASARAYSAIREAILDGEYGPGTYLREVEIADLLGVSRTPVREALRRLSAEGVLELEPNRGARVSRWTTEMMHEIFELRALLESFAAGRAASNVSEEEIGHLADLAQEMIEVHREGGTEATERISILNTEFHKGVAAAASVTQLEEMLSSVIDLSLVVRTFRRYTAESMERSLRQHLDLVAALRARAPQWAAATMRAHLLAAQVTILPDAGPDEPDRDPPLSMEEVD